MSDWGAISAHIAAVSGRPFRPAPPRTMGGGCINQSVTLSDGERSYFVKLNDSHRLEMFEAEAAGLDEIAASASIRVPLPLCTGTAGNEAYFAMEYLKLGGHSRKGTEEAGRQLAGMHRTTRDSFGWKRDNTIGSTPQLNELESDWIVFWRERRLAFQLDLAERNGHGGRLQERGRLLMEKFGALIDHSPVSSLLHGDLWGGNMGYGEDERPVIYDPAVYFGDREADLAMTELFGGFGSAFYDAYREAWPLDPGYEVRRDLYNLYHIINHLNLFGSGYLGQAQGMIERLLAEIG
jgi:fructosamine-3-kinase